jgi:hypothetical protein
MASRRQRNHEPEDNNDAFEDSFVVQGPETFFIDNEAIVVEDALHVVKDGKEYVFIDDQLYPVERNTNEPENIAYYHPTQHEHPKPSSSVLTIISFIVIAMISFAVVYFIAGPFIISIVSGASFNPENPDVISPSGGIVTYSPQAVATQQSQSQSKESQRAEKIKNAMDYSNPVTRDYALTLIPKSHSGSYSIAQICDLWQAAYKKWTYVDDPNGVDYYSPASRTIQLGMKGDCDDFAITVGSLIQSIGGSSRIVTAYNVKSGHAYPEVLVATSEAKFNSIASYIAKRYGSKSVAYHVTYKDNVPYYWLNLDWQSGSPGGKFFDSTSDLTIYYPNGYWYKSS